MNNCGISSREALRKICENCHFDETVCDVNLRKDCYDKDSVKFCLNNATVLKISDEEEPTLRAFGYYAPTGNTPEQIAKAIADKFLQIKYIIITLGSKGAYDYYVDRGAGFFKEAKKVKVASTVGAGDSFIAAWISSYLAGNTPEIATERAVALSSFVVSRTDAIPSYRFEGGVINEI